MTVYIIETVELSAEQLEKMSAALPASRRRRAEQIRNPMARRESITAAYLALYGLAAGDTGSGLVFPAVNNLLAKSAEAGEFSVKFGWPVDKSGKPFPDGVSHGKGRLYVSLSHSEGLAAAVVADEPVGADIQHLSASSSEQLLRIASKFHPKERSRLAMLPKEELSAAFCRLWACKESVMKLCGRGLSLPLSSFCIEENESELDGRRIRLYAQTLGNAAFAAAFWA